MKVKEDNEKEEAAYYTIGHNAMNLILAWETQKLAEKTNYLTWLVIILTGIILAVSLLPYLQYC